MGFFQGERAKICTFTGPKIKLSTKADLKGDNAVLTIKRILYTKADLKGDNTVLTFTNRQNFVYRLYKCNLPGLFPCPLS